MSGFLKLYRGQMTDALLRRPAAFALYALIATRARRSYDTINPRNLAIGEAHIGDLGATATSEATYRATKKWLEKHGLATFKPTNKGTVATITSTEVFDINADEDNEQHNDRSANRLPKSNEQADEQSATNKKLKKPKKEEAKEEAVVFPDVLNTELFKSAWNDWHAYASARRLRKWVPQTVAAKLSELAAMGEAEAVAAIRASIANGWQSIFPAKTNLMKTTNQKGAGWL